MSPTAALTRSTGVDVFLVAVAAFLRFNTREATEEKTRRGILTACWWEK